MGGLLTNIFDKNACVIRKTRFNIFWKFTVYFQIFSLINKNDIFRKQNFIFEQKVIFNIDFYDPKDLKKHSPLIFTELFFLWYALMSDPDILKHCIFLSRTWCFSAHLSRLKMMQQLQIRWYLPWREVEPGNE